MTRDENFSLYAYVLAAALAIFACSTLMEPAKVEVAAISLDAVEIGAIETASIGPREAAERAAWNAPTIPWLTYEDGLKRMQQEGKPGLLVLQAQWCLVCRNYQRLFHEDDIARYAEDYVFILADIDREPGLQRRFDIDGDYIPRTFVLSPEGALTQDATGDHPRQRFFVDPFRKEQLADLLDRSR